MNYLFIRGYQKDDYIGRLAIESWFRAGFKGEVINYSERYEQKWMKDIGRTIWRDGSVANFGGIDGAVCLMDGFRQLDLKDDDYLIQTDTDIVMYEDIMKLIKPDTQFAGRGGINTAGYFHLNNELTILRGDFVKKLIEFKTKDDFWPICQELIDMGSSFSDGEYMAYMGHKHGYKLQEIDSKGKWLHLKFYEYNDRPDFQNVIDEIKTKHL